jgi:hypothetical protein
MEVDEVVWVETEERFPRLRLRVYADPAGHPFCIFVAGPVGGG